MPLVLFWAEGTLPLSGEREMWLWVLMTGSSTHNQPSLYFWQLTAVPLVTSDVGPVRSFHARLQSLVCPGAKSLIIRWRDSKWQRFLWGVLMYLFIKLTLNSHCRKHPRYVSLGCDNQRLLLFHAPLFFLSLSLSFSLSLFQFLKIDRQRANHQHHLLLHTLCGLACNSATVC